MGLKDLANKALSRDSSWDTSGTAEEKSVPLAPSRGTPRGTPETWDKTGTAADFSALANLPLSELEHQHLAIRIESQLGSMWLVSTERERDLVDDDAPVYSVLEAKQMCDMPQELALQVHRFKQAFGGKLDGVKQDDNP